MKIVIVEDDPGIRKELKQLLENAFYEAEIIEEFKNTAEQICSMIPAPDLVLLDWNLPGESGFDIYLYEAERTFRYSNHISDQPDGFHG